MTSSSLPYPPRRTLPRVRELKLVELLNGVAEALVAPFPGCVN